MLSITQNLSLILGRTVVTYCMRLEAQRKLKEAQRKSTNDTSLTVCICAVVLKVIGWLQLTQYNVDNTTLIVHTCSHSEYALAFSLKKLMVVFLEGWYKAFCAQAWRHLKRGVAIILSSLAPRSQIQAAPMQSILARLRHQEYIKLVIFSDHTILKEPVEKWPLCNCLIAFYSKVTVFLLHLEAWHFRWTAVPVHARCDKPRLQTSTWRHSTYSSILF